MKSPGDQLLCHCNRPESTHPRSEGTDQRNAHGASYVLESFVFPKTNTVVNIAVLIKVYWNNNHTDFKNFTEMEESGSSCEL